MELFLEFLLECVLEIVGEVILGLTHALNEDDAARPAAVFARCSF